MDDEQSQSTRVDVHYDEGAGEWKSESTDSFDIDALKAEKGTVFFLLLPFAFFFQPSKFTRSFSIHCSGLFLFAVVWMTGTALVFNSFVKDGVTSSLSSYLESWFTVVIYSVIIGVLRGGFVYVLGGWWYRVRLGFCGYEVSDRVYTGRVYMNAGIGKHVLALMIYSIASLRHDTFLSYVNEDSMIAPFVESGLLFCLIFWSSFTLYFSTRAVFPTKKLASIAWFLVLPIMLQLLGIAMAVIGLLIPMLGTEPQLTKPSVQTGETFQFEYPSNWFVTEDEEVPAPEFWIQVEPLIADARFEFELRNNTTPEDLVEAFRAYYEEDAGLLFVGEPVPLTTQGKFQGYGFEYDTQIEGTDFITRLFSTTIEEGTEMIITVLAEKSIWDEIKPGYDHILKTLKVANPSELVPDLDSTYTIHQPPFEIQIPKNWWVDTIVNDDRTNDDGSVSLGGISTLIQTPGWGYFRIMVYESDLSPSEELDVSLDSYIGESQLIDDEPLESWLGLDGVGVRGNIVDPAGEVSAAFFFVTRLSDGRMIEFRFVVPDEYVDFYASGFELLQSSFKLLPDSISESESESVDPDDEP